MTYSKSVGVSLEMQFSSVLMYLNIHGHYSFLSHNLIPLDFFLAVEDEWTVYPEPITVGVFELGLRSESVV